MAIIRNNQRTLIMPQLKEQSVYDISNFKIVPGPSTYRSVDMDMAINFFYKTTIQEAEDNNSIPHYKFELQPFHRVKDLVGRVKNLIGKTQNQVIPHLTRSAKIIQLFPLQIDVIGMVTTIGRLEKRSNGVEKLDVALTDNRYSSTFMQCS